VQPGDIIKISFPTERTINVKPQEIPINIMYEDEYLMIINKDAGMVVHPSRGHLDSTLVNAILFYCKSIADVGDSLRPGIVHRLDKDTTGLLLVAKTEATRLILSQNMENREIKRKYKTLVWGNPLKSDGEILAPIGRNPRERKKMTIVEGGKPAHSIYHVIERFGWCTLLEVELKTGRTHQIRVHMYYEGYPVIGDKDYGIRRLHMQKYPNVIRELVTEINSSINRQFLHAFELSFIHPFTGKEIKVNSELPDDLMNALNRIRKQAEIAVNGVV
jgi:23S rRNA pseudouridine1911/1915/1917 synthase